MGKPISHINTSADLTAQAQALLKGHIISPLAATREIHDGWCMLNMLKKDMCKACVADSAESAYPLQPAADERKAKTIQWDSKRASGECRVCEREVERRECAR